MILDAPTFELSLTPEAALSIIDKEVKRRRWSRFELEDIHLVYTPYYVFSFDVNAEGNQQPTGRAAINATTGEVDEFVPQLLERPFKKMKQTDPKSPKAEVEATNITPKQLETVAPAKIAAAVGLKKDTITVSAIAKYYIPFYRIWATIPAEVGDSYKISVDGLMGAPIGMDAVPGKEKGFEESSEEAFEKLKTPRGWGELINETITAVSKGGPGGLFATSLGRWMAMLLIIVVLAFLVFRPPSVGAECKPGEQYLTAPEYYLFGAQYLKPKKTAKGDWLVEGTCAFTNNEKEALTSCVRMNVKNGEIPVSGNNTCVANLVPGGVTEKSFTISWTGGSSSAKYTLDVQKVV